MRKGGLSGENMIGQKMLRELSSPYQRLLQTKGVAVKVKKQVMRIYNGLNLVELRGASEKLKYQLFQTVIG